MYILTYRASPILTERQAEKYLLRSVAFLYRILERDVERVPTAQPDIAVVVVVVVATTAWHTWQLEVLNPAASNAYQLTYMTRLWSTYTTEEEEFELQLAVWASYQLMVGYMGGGYGGV